MRNVSQLGTFPKWSTLAWVRFATADWIGMGLMPSGSKSSKVAGRKEGGTVMIFEDIVLGALWLLLIFVVGVIVGISSRGLL